MRALLLRGRAAADDPAAERVRTAASNLVIDATAGTVVEALRADGVSSILLKGASLDRWLYGPDSPRPYGDIDLLVRPSDIDASERTLARLGFTCAALMYRPPHADVWTRRSDGMDLDLHHRLIGVELEPDAAWELLAAQTEPMLIGAVEVNVLAPGARAMHVALHAAQHGAKVRPRKPLTDLTLALDLLPRSTWEEASSLAARLEAVPAFATGLRFVPAGQELADRLGLPTELPIDMALFAVTAPFSSRFVSRVAETAGLRAKMRLVAAKVVPGRDFMRAWSPLARRGPIGLGAAYLWRQVWLVWHGPPALLAWWRARRLTG